MKLLIMMLLAATSLLTVLGCESVKKRTRVDKASVNAKLVRSVQDTAIVNAIIRQHTVFPYHFVQNSSELNGLGQRDLQVLAEHYGKYPGQLNVRSGGASKDLYRARIETVLAFLHDAGVKTPIDVGDDLPGGDGMPSEQVVLILKEEKETSASDSSDDDESE